MLFQGQQRRIAAIVKPVSNSGMLPIICESIQSISVGGPCVRSELQKPLDSYQEDDLNRLRQRWGDALAKRKEVDWLFSTNFQNITNKLHIPYLSLFKINIITICSNSTSTAK